MNLRRLLSVVAGLLLLLATVHADEGVPPFRQGERIAFLGDSIFHGGRTQANLLLFQATRYPSQPVHIINAGIAGDTAEGAFRRLDWELKPAAPTLTIIMLGMNDVGRWLYGEGKDSPANLAQRQRLLETHYTSLSRLLDEVARTGSKIVLCTPTPYDQTVVSAAGNAKGVDDALVLVAENARRLAKERGYPLVDFHAPMNRILKEQQARNPSFTMMDAMRVHPDEAGHLLMTYLLLKEQGIPAVSIAVFDAKIGKNLENERVNCTISNVQMQGAELSFDLLAGSLPFPIEGKTKPVLQWVPLMDDLNREQLVVLNLAPGSYELLIDGASVGTYPADARGKLAVNLAASDKTPQYQQALEVMRLCEKWRSRENATLRIFAALEHDVLRPKGVDTTDLAAVRTAMEKAIEQEAQARSWRHSYFVNLSKVYYAEKPNQKAIEKELADLTRQIFQAAQPRPHHYQLRPAPTRTPHHQ